MIPLEVILFPPNLVYDFAVLTVLAWAWRRGDRDLRTFATFLAVAQFGGMIEIEWIDRRTYNLVTDLIMVGLLTNIACARGCTWAIAVAGFWFNCLIVTAGAWLGQLLGTGLNPIVVVTLNMFWAYLAMASAVYGLRSLRRARDAGQGASQHPGELEDGLPEGVAAAA